MVLLKLRGEMTGMKSPGTEEKSQRGKRPLGSRLARTAGPQHRNVDSPDCRCESQRIWVILISKHRTSQRISKNKEFSCR